VEIWNFLHFTWDDFLEWLPFLVSMLYVVVSVLTIVWVLWTKTDSTSAVAWCLLVLLVPLVGAAAFVLFGYQHVERPLRRKRRHRQRFRAGRPAAPEEKLSDHEDADGLGQSMVNLARRCGAFPLGTGHGMEFYFEGRPAFDAMLEAIAAARHHVHLEFFIFQPDRAGRQFIELLAARAKEGVQVRLLYDAMGSIRLRQQTLKPLVDVGGKCSVFLPLNPLRRRIQVNMRNHRKILVVDGKVAFVGGLNIGDEYVGLNPYFGFWRDTHLRIEGPAVADLQQIFLEDWDFAAGEALHDPKYYDAPTHAGPYPAQVIDSGPDRALKSIREMYFAAILRAKRRVWIASPYFVPDAGLRDALRLAGFQGVDVRLLCQFKPDKFIPQYAARYYWTEMLEAGVKIYQYTRGMMHSKVVIADDAFASVGTANLDNRSLSLNFEVNCQIYSREAVAELEAAFLRDLEHAVRLDKEVYAKRPFPGRLLENTCRLMSPVL
jgi:cardiolipin synthase